MSQEKARQEHGNMTIGTFVAEDYRVADVLEKYGIDFCCGGQATFVVNYHKFKEFEDDLHKHVHLENNILFLKAAQL